MGRLAPEDLQIAKGKALMRLRQACVQKDLPTMEKCLAAGADVNFRDLAGQTCLLVLARHIDELAGNIAAADVDPASYLPVLERLLEAGANINEQDNDPIGVGHLFATRPVLLRWALDKGASVHALSGYNWTPLHYAVEAGNAECVRLLMERGSDPHVPDVMGCTPLDTSREEDRDPNITAHLISLEHARVLEAEVVPGGAGRPRI